MMAYEWEEGNLKTFLKVFSDSIYLFIYLFLMALGLLLLHKEALLWLW